MKIGEIKKAVKSAYARVALQHLPCCGPGSPCSGGSKAAEAISRKIGYGDAELKAVPEGANLGLGCGNPVAMASIQEGQVVLDLGSGAGFDCFIAASKVGSSGRVIGIDMTPEMIDKARRNAQEGRFDNVEFRLGEIEKIPVPDDFVDLVISNCVINLSTDKKQVFKEAFRILKPGGRLMIADIVILKELPEIIRKSVEAYVGCLAGAIKKEQYLAAIEAAGFQTITVVSEDTYPIEHLANDPIVQSVCASLELSQEGAQGLANSVASIKVSAVKPD